MRKSLKVFTDLKHPFSSLDIPLGKEKVIVIAEENMRNPVIIKDD
jgi:hypothetical protein